MYHVTRNKKKNSQAGLSLVEVIVSMLMIAVILVLYASALSMVNASRKLRYENLAYHIANTQMETLRQVPYSSLSGSGTISDALLSQIPSGSGSYDVASYPGYTGLKEITVTVTWNDGLSKQVQLKTISGNGGLNP